MSAGNPSRQFAAGGGHRYDFLHLFDGRVRVEGIEVEFPRLRLLDEALEQP